MSKTATICSLDDVYFLRINKENINVKKSTICNFSLIDNSGSMGRNTLDATKTICKGLFGLPTELVNQSDGELIYFDDGVTCHQNININNFDNYPPPRRQGMTNITLAIETAIQRIVQHKKHIRCDCQYILTFLSDGDHNQGAELNEYDLMRMRQELEQNEILLSIIVIGISSSNVKLGMKIKNSLETLAINSLSSVYYADSFIAMNNVLNDLIMGCNNFLGGTPYNLYLENGVFVENNQNILRTIIDPNDHICIKGINNIEPILYCDNILVEFKRVQFDVTDLENIINNILPTLSRQKLAHGTNNISEAIKVLENCISTAEKLSTTLNSSEPFQQGVKLTPAQRVRLLKQSRTLDGMFKETRNKLRLLQANISNNSRSQASYLDGFNRKFASKAIQRSDMTSITVDDVLKELRQISPELKRCIEQDKMNGFLEDSSYLSLCSPLEQIEEWLQFEDIEFTNIYSLLVSLGFSCYPVKYRHNNAVQMDPFQTECLYIEPFLMDTATIMLANQTNNKIVTPSRNIFSDGLVLINPSAQKSMLLLTETLIYKYYCSVTLCRDLNMYNPKMSFSMHAHALIRTLYEYKNTGSLAYLELALKIVYSSRLMRHFKKNLFESWFVNWSSITQSAEDNCDHPVQLLLMFASHKVDNYHNYLVPLINLCNEILARTFKKFLGNYENSIDKARELMRRLFDINEYNSPSPDLENPQDEPNINSIRENCQRWANVVDTSILNKYFNGSTIEECIEKILFPYILTFEFGLNLQQYQGNWEHDFLENSEQVILYLQKTLDSVNSAITYIGYDKDITIQTAFLQAVLYHTSKSRQGIIDKDIFNSETFSEMIVDLRMQVYIDQYAKHREQFQRILANNTLRNALNADLNLFTNMVGGHTHGHSKEIFWSLLEGAIDDPDKLQVFINRSNSTVDTAIQKLRFRKSR